MTLREELLSLADPRYREFTASLVPGIGELLGVRIPQLRRIARRIARPGDVVSLSPASASFDLYPNFEVRGRDYKNIVKNLK